MKIAPACGLFPYSVWKLRYLEWLLLAIHLMLAITGGWDRPFLYIAVYGIFLIFSWILPINRPLLLRKAYILLVMSLIVCANFLGVSLDLLLYLYIAKSFLLIRGKNTLYITILTGIGWIASECFAEIQQLNSLRFEPPFGFDTYNLSTIFIYSSGIYLAGSIFTIFLSSLIVAEHKSRKRAETLAKQVEVLATDLERTRIARDIHDSLGHTLTGLDIQLKVAQKLRDRDISQAFAAIDTAKILSAQCIEDVSHAVRAMRSSNFDLERALNNLIEELRNNERNLQVKWNIDLPQLPVTTNHQIYCIVKEGLINIKKHAQASSICFYGKYNAEEIILRLEDNGIGFTRDRECSGLGLRGVGERVELIGGKLKISSASGRGTQILVTIPR